MTADKTTSNRGPWLPKTPEEKYSFSSMSLGNFLQAEERTDDTVFSHLKCNFGRVQNSWAEFKQDFDKLISTEDSNTRYKLLFLARHGQGYHNFMIEKYGQEAWDKELNIQMHNDQYTWAPDPELTPQGEGEASQNNTEWAKQIKEGIPVPQEFYVSPMTRSINTMLITWKGNLDLVGDRQPLIVEGLRETMNEDRCNVRRPKSYTAERFPQLVFDTGFPEKDEAWDEANPEDRKGHQKREEQFLSRLFAKDWDSADPTRVVSTTSHAGTVLAFLNAIGHREFHLPTAGMVPVIVKATRSTQ